MLGMERKKNLEHPRAKTTNSSPPFWTTRYLELLPRQLHVSCFHVAIILWLPKHSCVVSEELAGKKVKVQLCLHTANWRNRLDTQSLQPTIPAVRSVKHAWMNHWWHSIVACQAFCLFISRCSDFNKEIITTYHRRQRKLSRNLRCTARFLLHCIYTQCSAMLV